MDTVIRCFAKTPRRFELARDTVRSAVRQGLHTQGNLCLQNGHAQFDAELREAAALTTGGCSYRYEPDQDILHGFVRALDLVAARERPALVCTDDVRFGRGAGEALRQIEHEIIPAFHAGGVRWGIIGLFACYARAVNGRYAVETPLGREELPVFRHPAQEFYGGIAIVLNPVLVREIERRWADITAGRRERPQCMEDIWLNWLMTELGLGWFNTVRDYAWHTGNDDRVAAATGGQYQTEYFVGE